MPATIYRQVAEQLEADLKASGKPEADITDVTVPVGAVADPLFTTFIQEFVQRFPSRGPIPSAQALAIQCFQAGMLYERAQQRHPISFAPDIAETLTMRRCNSCGTDHDGRNWPDGKPCPRCHRGSPITVQ